MAYSLGIDLGFGQPMEHVLRQCLIALRIAERAGLDEDQRASVYYTALLIDVGCHTDAHEQARWFGDDIAMKSAKYEGPLRGVRATATGLRSIGAGHPLIQRLRIGISKVRVDQGKGRSAVLNADREQIRRKRKEPLRDSRNSEAR